jgi:hypothetical protein
MTLKILPVFEGYTIDVKLKQFRKVDNKGIHFIDFDSVAGEKLLSRYIRSLDSKSHEFKEFIHHF